MGAAEKKPATFGKLLESVLGLLVLGMCVGASIGVGVRSYQWVASTSCEGAK